MTKHRWFFQPPVFVTVLILAFVLILFVNRAFRADDLLSGFEITPEKDHTIIIEAGIDLEVFHMEKFQKYGKMLKVDGNTVYLRAVSSENLQWFAHQPWVKTISHWDRG